MFFQVFQVSPTNALVCLGQFVIHVAKFTKIKETLLTILTHNGDEYCCDLCHIGREQNLG